MNNDRDGFANSRGRVSRPSRSDESLLVEQLRNGNEAALDSFVRDYWPGVYRYLLLLTNAPDDAADLTQMVMVQACRNIDTYDANRGALDRWLRVIAHSRCVDWVRTRKAPASLMEALPLADRDGERAFMAVDVRASLGTLRVEIREVVALVHFDGYTVEETAQIVGRPAGTIKRWLSEARRELRRVWVMKEGDPDGRTGKGI